MVTPSPSPSSNRRANGAWQRLDQERDLDPSTTSSANLAVSYLDRTDLAHVAPQGASFDDVGRGRGRGAVSNVSELSESAATKFAGGAQADQLHRLPAQGGCRRKLVVLHGGRRRGSCQRRSRTLVPEARNSAGMPEVKGASTYRGRGGHHGDRHRLTSRSTRRPRRGCRATRASALRRMRKLHAWCATAPA